MVVVAEDKEEIWVIKTRYHHPWGAGYFARLLFFSFWFLGKMYKRSKNNTYKQYFYLTSHPLFSVNWQRSALAVGGMFVLTTPNNYRKKITLFTI